MADSPSISAASGSPSVGAFRPRRASSDTCKACEAERGAVGTPSQRACVKMGSMGNGWSAARKSVERNASSKVLVDALVWLWDGYEPNPQERTSALVEPTSVAATHSLLKQWLVVAAMVPMAVFSVANLRWREERYMVPCLRRLI